MTIFSRRSIRKPTTEDNFMADTTGIAAEVSRANTVEASAAALIRGFQTKLDAAIQQAIADNDAADLSALTSLSDQLKASSDDLEAAVTENTPTP
jgi:hypothetical protein